MNFKIESKEIDRTLILHLDGDLDTHAAPVLEREILHRIEGGQIHLLLDFSSVDYLASAGLRVLHASAKKIKEKNGKFILFDLREGPLEILKETGFHKLFTVCASEAEALKKSSGQL
jgi:anti-anti-sigma factor